MQKLKVNDEVIVLAGKDKGKSGKLLKVNQKLHRLIWCRSNIGHNLPQNKGSKPMLD